MSSNDPGQAPANVTKAGGGSLSKALTETSFRALFTAGGGYLVGKYSGGNDQVVLAMMGGVAVLSGYAWSIYNWFLTHNVVTELRKQVNDLIT